MLLPVPTAKDKSEATAAAVVDPVNIIKPEEDDDEEPRGCALCGSTDTLGIVRLSLREETAGFTWLPAVLGTLPSVLATLPGSVAIPTA